MTRENSEIEVLVPCVAVGLGTGRAWVRDALTRVRVPVEAATVVLAGGVVCVRAESLGRDGRHHRVRLPGGAVAWVEVLAGGHPGRAA